MTFSTSVLIRPPGRDCRSTMPITHAQSTAILEVINIILAAMSTKGKRQLAGMFLELVDRTDWPQYYEVRVDNISRQKMVHNHLNQIIPEPRCLNAIKSGVEKGRYKEATDVYTDLSLVFWNALFYNEPTSQIGSDAKILKVSHSGRLTNDSDVG